MTGTIALPHWNNCFQSLSSLALCRSIKHLHNSWVLCEKNAFAIHFVHMSVARQAGSEGKEHDGHKNACNNLYSLKKWNILIYILYWISYAENHSVSVRAPERVFANCIPTNLWACSHQRKQVFLLFFPSWLTTSILADEDFQDQPKCSTWFQLRICQMRHSKHVCSFKGLAMCTLLHKHLIKSHLWPR